MGEDSRAHRFPLGAPPRMTRVLRDDKLYPHREKTACFIYEGLFLTNEEVIEGLKAWSPGDEEVAESAGLTNEGAPKMVAKVSDTLKWAPDMLAMYKSLEARSFPVVRLKHVTIKDYFHGIVQEGCLRGLDRAFLLNGAVTELPVSCWAADIPPENVKNVRKKRFKELMARLSEGSRAGPPRLSRWQRASLQDMLANSRALSPDSRYGNFQFSFRVKELLSEYRKQHCSGKKPVLRVLGTEAYKLEIAHWVLIHSPHCRDFDHLPTVDPPGPLSRDGNLKWIPQSMSDRFTWKFNPGNGALAQQPEKYNAWVWNDVVYAFYLPEGATLWLGRQRLLESVGACEALRDLNGDISNICRHSKGKYVCKEEAEGIISQVKGC
ncbi:uncharacterized protein [Ambystoma mexicanum]|uniref:uncharacterized protein n=1 Tax=Ambystoma mexicanum TaxID=8296 RepID=UPI0037E84F7B